MQAISLTINTLVISASPIALKGGGVSLLVNIFTCHLGFASIFIATLIPLALASNVAFSLTGLQDCHNTLHIPELQITILQFIEHLNKPALEVLCSLRPDVIVLAIGASQPLHELSLSY